MKQLLIVVALVSAACSSGGGGPRPQPPPSLATLAVVVADQFGAVVEGAVLDVSAIPGTRDGVTNADGYVAVIVPRDLTPFDLYRLVRDVGTIVQSLAISAASLVVIGNNRN